ncbi:MAG: SHOCT domain-containing protein [Eubacterium sp.]|nr:SHOCT domain-containing protein [Eubacterium sp.]
MSNTDELLELKKLLDNGVLTQEEFDSQKEAILNNKDLIIQSERKGKRKKSKRVITIIVAVITFAIVICGAVFFVINNGLLDSPLEALEKTGDYKTAYESVDDSVKETLIIESRAAQILQRYNDTKLIAWWYKDNEFLAELELKTTSMSPVIVYEIYTYDSTKDSFTSYGYYEDNSFSNLYTGSTDSSTQKLVNVFGDTISSMAHSAYEDGIKLGQDSIDRINAINDNGMINNVESVGKYETSE